MGLSRLLPPGADDPAAMMRWIRGVEFLMIPLGILVALLLRAEDIGVWWLGFVVSAMGLVGLVTVGSAIRRAEAHGPHSPATRPERLRRANRLTALTYGTLTVVAVIVCLVAGETTLAITFAVAGPLCIVLGLWLTRRILNRR